MTIKLKKTIAVIQSEFQKIKKLNYQVRNINFIINKINNDLESRINDIQEYVFLDCLIIENNNTDNLKGGTNE